MTTVTGARCRLANWSAKRRRRRGDRTSRHEAPRLQPAFGPTERPGTHDPGVVGPRIAKVGNPRHAEVPRQPTRQQVDGCGRRGTEHQVRRACRDGAAQGRVPQQPGPRLVWEPQYLGIGAKQGPAHPNRHRSRVGSPRRPARSASDSHDRRPRASRVADAADVARRPSSGNVPARVYRSVRGATVNTKGSHPYSGRYLTNLPIRRDAIVCVGGYRVGTDGNALHGTRRKGSTVTSRR